VRDGDEEDDGTLPPRDWLGDLGAGAVAALGAGVFVLSIVAMVAIDRIGGTLTPDDAAARIVAPEVEGVAFEVPRPAPGIVSPRADDPTWMINAAAFDAPPGRPVMAVIVLDDGTQPETALQALDWNAPFSFAIAADFDLSPHRVERVRRAGREALALVPFGYGPDLGADPNVLRRGLSEAELVRRLRWHLARAGGEIVGAIDGQSGDILRDAVALRIVGDELAAGGMLMIDSREESDSLLSARLRPMGVPVGRRTARIARGDSHDVALDALGQAERHAGTWGTAIVLVEAGEGTMKALSEWVLTRGSDVAIAPVSHVIRQLRRGPQYAQN